VLLRVLLDGFHGALVAVAHEAKAAGRDASSRDDFLIVARFMGEALLGSGPRPRQESSAGSSA